MGQTALKTAKSEAKPTSALVHPPETSQNFVFIEDNTEEQLWDDAVANSLDAFREMAEKARANRQAGRTQKIAS